MNNIFIKDKETADAMKHKFQEDKELRHNGEGYTDTTAYEAIKNLDREEERYKKLLHVIFSICDLAGFKVHGRLALQNKKSERVYK